MGNGEKFNLAWTFINDCEKTPDGFLFSGISAGLKVSNAKDLALILSPPNSIWSCKGNNN